MPPLKTVCATEREVFNKVRETDIPGGSSVAPTQYQIV